MTVLGGSGLIVPLYVYPGAAAVISDWNPVASQASTASTLVIMNPGRLSCLDKSGCV